MTETTERFEENLLEKFRQLSPDEKRQALDFIDSLTSAQSAKEWIAFDEWALNLARKKGFSNLTEEEVARMIRDFRRG